MDEDKAVNDKGTGAIAQDHSVAAGMGIFGQHPLIKGKLGTSITPSGPGHVSHPRPFCVEVPRI